VQVVDSRIRRVAQVCLGVLAAALVAGLRDAPLPVTGQASPETLGISGSGSPLFVAGELARTVAAYPTLVLEAILLAGAALALPFARRRGLWAIAAFGAFLLAATILPASTSILPAALAAWAISMGLALKTELYTDGRG
jgi:hypothetical protein